MLLLVIIRWKRRIEVHERLWGGYKATIGRYRWLHGEYREGYDMFAIVEAGVSLST